MVNQEREQAEILLKNLACNPFYPCQLLELVHSKLIQSAEVKLRGAIEFKNFLLKDWTAEEITPADMKMREVITTVYMSSPK